MRLSLVVPTFLGFVSLFFISAGVGLRTIHPFAPYLGLLIGIIFFLFAGYSKGKLDEREMKLNDEKERKHYV